MVWRASSGNRRATTPTPSTHSTPPETTANCGLVSGRHDGRLDVAEARSAGHDQGVDRHHPAAELVRRLELDERRAEDRREHVGGAGDRQAERARAGTNGDQAERRDRQAPGDDRREDRAPGPPDRRHPAREERAEERAGRRCRGHQPEPAGPVSNTSSARTGKSDVGIPKIIALRSMTNVPGSRRRRRAKRRPSRIAVETRAGCGRERRQRLDGAGGPRATRRT